MEVIVTKSDFHALSLFTMASVRMLTFFGCFSIQVQVFHCLETGIQTALMWPTCSDTDSASKKGEASSAAICRKIHKNCTRSFQRKHCDIPEKEKETFIFPSE